MLRINDVLDLIHSKNPDADLKLIDYAYIYSARVHQGQIRLSGEPYLAHPLEVAFNIAKYTDDVECIACGLLHDVLEDTQSTSEEIKSIFGKEITELLLNFHKFVQFDSRLFRKSSLETFFIDYFVDANIECESSLLQKDKRILLIRLCDCIDNTKNLKFLRRQPHVDWLIHTNLNFRVPLAMKMGIDQAAKELEKLSMEQISSIGMKSPRVFLCYAREDKLVVDQLFKALLKAGLRPWMDEPPDPFDMMGLKPGEFWDPKIMQILKESDYIITFLSNASIIKQGYIQKEYRTALNIMNETPIGHIKVIPVLLEECEVPAIQVENVNLKNIQWFKLYSKSADKLIKTIINDFEERKNTVSK